MRVIAGTARRTPLVAPEGMNTRPTADRAKEALFSMLVADIVGARFLDLFCGSGAMGIEALSRGAAHVVFVEKAKPALAALRKNLASAASADPTITARAEVMAMDANGAVQWLHPRVWDTEHAFDIVFLDPPYEGNFLETMLGHLGHCPVTKEGGRGRIIAETDAKRALPEWAHIIKEIRDYGRTRFLFWRT